jgi:hypothetical protein
VPNITVIGFTGVGDTLGNNISKSSSTCPPFTDTDTLDSKNVDVCCIVAVSTVVPVPTPVALESSIDTTAVLEEEYDITPVDPASEYAESPTTDSHGIVVGGLKNS